MRLATALVTILLTAACAPLRGRATPDPAPVTPPTPITTAQAAGTPAPLAPSKPAEKSPPKAVVGPAPEKAPPKAPAAKAPAAAKASAPAPAPVAAPVAVPPAAPPASPPLDLTSLEARLRETKAIGTFTKLALKNQVDDLLAQFRAYHEGRQHTLAELRQPYELLIMKVLSLLQDGDPSLARMISDSREAIWGILTDKSKFTKI
jgi:hypothetical protein